LPPAQRLRSASGKGAADLKPKQSNGKINSERNIKNTIPPVGASLLAKNVNDIALQQDKRGADVSIASKLAPTGAAYACFSPLKVER
jgi:hypothetical protein